MSVPRGPKFGSATHTIPLLGPRTCEGLAETRGTSGGVRRCRKQMPNVTDQSSYVPTGAQSATASRPLCLRGIFPVPWHFTWPFACLQGDNDDCRETERRGGGGGGGGCETSSTVSKRTPQSPHGQVWMLIIRFLVPLASEKRIVSAQSDDPRIRGERLQRDLSRSEKREDISSEADLGWSSC